MNSRISFYQFLTSLFLILMFTVLFIANTSVYDRLSNEDSLIEYLSAITLALTGVIFLIAFNYSRKVVNSNFTKWRAILFLLLGIVFLLVAGEEISWGQRLFNIPTPDFLYRLNDQNEFNFHNVDKKFFDRLVDRLTIMFVVISSVLLILNKKVIIGIRTPDIFVISAFALTPFYNQYNNPGIDFFHIQYLALLALFIYSAIKRNKNHLFFLIVTLVVSVLLPLIHIKLNHLFPSHNNSANEYREFLFSVCCLFYSYIILTDQLPVHKIYIQSGTNT